MVPDAFNNIRTILVSSRKTIKALDAKAQVLALTTLNTVELVKWSEDSTADQNEARIVIALQQDDSQNMVSNDYFLSSFSLTWIISGMELSPFILWDHMSWYLG